MIIIIITYGKSDAAIKCHLFSISSRMINRIKWKYENNEWCSSLFRSVSFSDRFSFQNDRNHARLFRSVHILCYLWLGSFYFSLKKIVWLFIVILHLTDYVLSSSKCRDIRVVSRSKFIWNWILYMICMHVWKIAGPRTLLWPKIWLKKRSHIQSSHSSWENGKLHTISNVHNNCIHKLKWTESDM